MSDDYGVDVSAVVADMDRRDANRFDDSEVNFEDDDGDDE